MINKDITSEKRLIVSSLFTLIMVFITGLSFEVTTGYADPQSSEVAQVDETPKFASTQIKELKICELYESLALVKAKSETQLDADCTCQLTSDTCGKNWRGAVQKIFQCRCKMLGSCQVNTCSLSDITATAKATKLCKKPSCSCIKLSDNQCERGFLGKKSKPFRCDCPQD